MSAIISTVTAQQWGLLNKPELQAFQKIYDEELLSEGIVVFPVALERYYPRLGMSKTEFSFIRNLLQVQAKNAKKSWFALEHMEEIFGKNRRQVQRDARKLAKEGFIIISEWDELNGSGTHCIHYDCTPFLKMISQLVRVDQHRNSLLGKISAPQIADESSPVVQSPASNASRSSGSYTSFDVNLVPTTPPLPVDNISLEPEIKASSITHVSIVHNHIHMTPGKKFSNIHLIDMYSPDLVAQDASEQPAETNQTNHQHVPQNQYIKREPIAEPRLISRKAPDAQAESIPQPKETEAYITAPNIQPASSYPSYASTPSDREQVRQKNQQPTRLPLLSSVVMREISQALHDCAPQTSQRDTAIIYHRLLLINRIEDDLAIKNPDQHFANLIKSVFQASMATGKRRDEMMDHFMDELNQAAFHQFEEIKIMRYQRTRNARRQQIAAIPHAIQPPEPFQIVAQEPQQHQLDQRRLSAAINHTKIQQRARNFPAGEELVALALHMHVSMTEEEANEIEAGTASEQLLLDIQDAILLSYDQQPDEIANLNYA